VLRWGQDERGLAVVVIAEQAALPGYEAVDWAYLLRGCVI